VLCSCYKACFLAWRWLQREVDMISEGRAEMQLLVVVEKEVVSVTFHDMP
jgi:hypothetical protein